MTGKEIKNLKIGEKVIITLTDLFGNDSYVPATVSKILVPNAEDADDGYYYKEVYAVARVEGELIEYRLIEGRVKRAWEEK